MPYYAFPSNPELSVDTLSKFFPNKWFDCPTALTAIIISNISITYKLELGNKANNIIISVNNKNNILVKWSNNNRKFFWKYVIEQRLEHEIDYNYITAEIIGQKLIIIIPMIKRSYL